MVSVELPVTKCLRHYTVKPDLNYTCEIRSPVLSDVVLTKELRLTLSGFSIYRFLELKTKFSFATSIMKYLPLALSSTQFS